MKMDAPTYPPAIAFEQPAAVRTELSIYNVSVAEMKAAPKAWEVVTRNAPGLKMAASSSFLQPHLGNFTVADLLAFGRGPAPDAKKIDAEFRALPESEKPAQ
jgi:hypothetical protein